MKTLFKIGGGIIALLVVIYAVGFLLPDEVHVERRITVDAPAERIYALVSDFRQWKRWSPWAALDPRMRQTVIGEGVGQNMTWMSDHPDVGNGSQEIVALEAPSLVCKCVPTKRSGH